MVLISSRLAWALRLLREPSDCCYCAGLHMAVGLRWQSNHVVCGFLSGVFEKQTMVFVSGGFRGADVMWTKG